MVGFVFDLVKVGIRGKDIVVLGVVKKSVAKLQEERTVRKICAQDLMSMSVWRLQRYTQSNGCRPFGISALIVGFDYNGPPRLYQTDPSGTWMILESKEIETLVAEIEK
ncbi:Proteasome subunit alpha type-7 [Acipenser ruthenus]|uniref:Proteasome subunit alpha type-7 n=1 Tax=Acipenser ruthenus TaxID=7906 RepID=A0A444U1D1_ACIRT|nr:Proteasome subunit alpha type-7 [Acipenser ruthenus]